MGTVELAVGLAIGLLGTWIAMEVKACQPDFLRFIIRRAAQRLPLQYRDDYEAEWLRLIADLTSPTARVYHALSLWFAAGSIGRALDRSAERQPIRLLRMIDLCISLTATALLLPLFLVVALLIRLESDGPILYYTTYRGRGGQPFRFYRFRTAYVAPVWGPTEGMIGRWIRRLSINELPGLLSVVRGDMSLVGPPPKRLNQQSCPLSERYSPGLCRLTPSELLGGFNLRLYLIGLIRAIVIIIRNRLPPRS